MSNPLEQLNSVARRTWLKGAAALAGGTAVTVFETGCATQSGSVAAAGSCQTTIAASDSNAVVETTAGKVRGFTRNGIHTFKGVPYSASPEGAARWLPPSKPKPWTGVRNSMWFGPTCPQVARSGWANDENAFQFQWDDGQPGEDCLRVNLWTPGLSDGKKRPVLVWMHGGGYQAGSGQEQAAYNGENLARRGDLVVVSLNHRLGVLGYLNLSQFGEKYAASGNVGQLDLVAALEWVRDNIANFGGDPGNVLIFGQSGGGGKVTTLMGMPAAKGLFHKAVVQSGSLLNPNVPEDSLKLAAAVVAELGLSRSQVAKMHEMPVGRLIEACSAAVLKLGPPLLGGGRPLKLLLGPTVDGKFLPE
jgi:para-nitrobenzyl esterase